MSNMTFPLCKDNGRLFIFIPLSCNLLINSIIIFEEMNLFLVATKINDKTKHYLNIIIAKTTW